MWKHTTKRFILLEDLDKWLNEVLNTKYHGAQPSRVVGMGSTETGHIIVTVAEDVPN